MSYLAQGIYQPYYGSSIYGGVIYGISISAPPVQSVGWPAFFGAISDHLATTGVFGPGSTFWAIDPDSVIQWPSGPSPFGLVVPRGMHIAGDDIGGGRFSKLWTVTIDIHSVVESSYDASFQDTGVVTSSSLTVGPYALVHAIVDKLDQSYIRTEDGNYATVEFPRAVDIQPVYRFKQTSAYVSVPVTFEMLVEESMPSTWLPGATPPASGDI